ncbi:MAG: (d)CMP kinase [Nitrospinae bacterium]|nr:(d)CMP kinase [Nitrospinota bacterium]
MIITLDGPAGSGKSSTARALAKKLGAVYLDTGAMYRSVTLAAIESGVDAADAARLETISSAITIDFKDDPDGQRVIVNGRDRTLDIRTPKVEKQVSAVSAHKGVREKMVALQRKIAATHPKVVVEGRDTGSVVFPDAKHKFFLSADPQARAGRRAAQSAAQGIQSGDNLVREIMERDEKDSKRQVSPLVVPHGAVAIDNTNLSLDETIQKIIDLLA